MDRKRRKCTPKKNIVTKESLVERVTSLEKDLAEKDTQLKLVIAEFEHLKNERSKDKINFEVQKLELQTELNRCKEQCAKFQSEKEKLQKDFEDLQSARPNVEGRNHINFDNVNHDVEIVKLNSGAFAPFPDECVLKIFEYLPQNQLGQIARLCRRFSMLTRDASLWRKVDVQFHWSHKHQYSVVNSFLNILPHGVTSIRLRFLDVEKWYSDIDFEKLCMNLQKKCPTLKKLSVKDGYISESPPTVVIDFPARYLPDLKILELCHSQFGYETGEQAYFTSEIEVLDVSFCEMRCINMIPFSKMPHLNQLCLSNTEVNYLWFEKHISFLSQLNVLDLGGVKFNIWRYQIIQRHAFNLKELFICYAHLNDGDFVFFNPILPNLPNLKALCIRGSLGVTDKGIVSLIQSCPSLKNIYVNQEVAALCAANPFIVSNKGKLEILKVLPNCYDHPKVKL